MGDLYAGERAVKAKTTDYLPATKSMTLDGMGTGQVGLEVYNAYLARAVFPDLVRIAVQTLGGLLHRKPPQIDLPSALEPMRESCTKHGESLEVLLRRINEHQMVTGRLGLLLDLPEFPDPSNPLPYIALYNALSIRNWDDASEVEGESRLNLVVLDESSYIREGFEWEMKERYRVLRLGELNALEGDGEAEYFAGLFEGTEYVEEDMIVPQLRGTSLQQIPFVFVNSKDLVPEPDAPPLEGLGAQALAIYRGEADYRQNLFMQGQDTLVVVGQANGRDSKEGQPVRTGAGSMIQLDQGGDAKYIGVNSSGLSEQRQALAADRRRGEILAGQLMDNSSRGESGVALQTRLGAQTATINEIAISGAAALQKILRVAAEWMGANPEEVKVTPNLEFANHSITGQDAMDIMTARAMGAPLSIRSIHGLFAERGLTKMNYQQERELIEEENEEMPPPPVGNMQFQDARLQEGEEDPGAAQEEE